MITARQCRMARAALDWNVKDLAREAGISAMTVTRFETGQTTPNRLTLAAIKRVLEGAGVEFTPDDGVKMRPSQAAELQ